MKRGIRAFIVLMLCTAMLTTGFPLKIQVADAITESTTSYTEYVQNWNAEAGGNPNGWLKWAEDSTCSEFELYDGMGHTGNRSLRITNDDYKLAYWYQEITGLTIGATYRVEGWIKPWGVRTTQTHGACLNVDMMDTNNNVISSVHSNELNSVHDWTRVSFVFTVASGTAKISLQAKLWSNYGTVYFDDISLKREYMLNSSVEIGTASPDNYFTWSNGSPTFIWDDTVSKEGNRSLKIYQSSAISSGWYQSHTGLTVGNTYTLAGWVKTDTVSSGGNGAYLSIDMKNSGGTIIQTVVSPQLHNTNDWTYLTCTFTVVTGTVTVAASQKLYGSSGSAWFDDLSIVPSTAELVANGGMEMGTQNPDGFVTWANPSGQSTFTWDNTAFLSSDAYAVGHRSLKITNDNSTVASSWHQDYLDLTVGKTYKLMGWIKTSNASGLGACFSIGQRDSGGVLIREDNTNRLTGTNDWTYVTETITVQSGCANAIVNAKLYGTSGTAWFDAISVIEVGTAISEPSLMGNWWNNFPRFTWVEADQKAISYIEPSVLTYVHGMMDEGRGPYFRQITYDMSKLLKSFLDAESIKKMAYLEGQGTTAEIIGAIHSLGGGTYEQDPSLNNGPKLYSHFWNWDYSGPGMNSNADTVVWMGLASYVNSASWLGSYILSGLAAPTYHDGSSALGYTDGSTNPYKAKIYDAIASKDINGGICVEQGGTGVPSENKNGTITIQQWGVNVDNVGYFRISKDSASPWWMQYNVKTARFYIDNGIDGFWVDNYTGGNALHFIPVKYAFGSYSVEGFRDFLVSHPIPEVPDPSTFDVRAYLKNQFTAWWPTVDPSDLNNTTTILKWREAQWLNNNVWKSYLSYKSETQSQRATELYNGIKNEASAAGKNPDDIFIGGNDVARLTFAATDGTQMDAVNCEYNPAYNLVPGGTKSDGIAPYGRGGTFYEMASNFAKSRNASIWLYLEGADAAYRGKTSLGEVLGFEALAHNCKLNDGYKESKIATNRLAGNNNSARIVNRFMKAIASVFDKREKYAKVGLMYSSSSELLGLAPSGFSNTNHVQAFNGWGQALEDLNVPYKVIPDFKLTLDNLSDIQVLIIPFVDCISQSLIDNVLIPFHNNGGTIKISGSTSGNKDLRQNQFANHTSALLYDLTTSGVAEFITGQADIDFYGNHLIPGISRTNSLNALSSVISALYTSKKLDQVLQLTNINDFVNTTTNYDSTANRFFVDFVNGNIDKPTDTITDEDGGTVVLKLPANLQGGTYNVKWYDGESEGSYTSPSYTIVDSTKISVSVPSFHVYGTLVISR